MSVLSIRSRTASARRPPDLSEFSGDLLLLVGEERHLVSHLRLRQLQRVHLPLGSHLDRLQTTRVQLRLGHQVTLQHRDQSTGRYFYIYCC